MNIDFLYTNTKILKWLILLALILLIVSLMAFWFGGSSFSENNVELTIEGPSQAAVGDEVVYKVKYANNNKLDLNNLRFKFTYPDESVVVKDGKISSNLTENFELDKLDAGKSGEKEFRAFLVGDRGNIKNAKVDLTFIAGNLRSNFNKNAVLATTITSLPVSLTLVAPPNVVSGQTISYILDYRNESGNDISDLRFEFDYPDGFSTRTFNPSTSQGNNVWIVPLLQKGKGNRITVQGVLNGSEGSAQMVSVTLKRKIGEEYVNFEKTSASSVINNPLLGVSSSVNGTRDYAAYAGDTLSYSIKYANNSNFNLSGVNLTVKLDGEMFDLSSLDTAGGFFDSSTNTILWNSGAVSDFSNLQPNKRGQVDFRIKLKTGFSSASGSKNLFVKISTKLSAPNNIPNVGGDEIFATDELVTKITSSPVLNESAYYNDSAFGSSGPLPPQVGQETAFTIHWQVVNPGNDLNNSKITGILPPGVQWKNVTSVGAGQPEITFNTATSEVTWNFGVLPRGVGIDTSKYEGSFQVSIKPSVNQKGNVVLLLKNVKLIGVDSFTKQDVVVPAPDVTTNDLNDRPGEGIVQ